MHGLSLCAILIEWFDFINCMQYYYSILLERELRR